jgi:hypothetical protein
MQDHSKLFFPFFVREIKKLRIESFRVNIFFLQQKITSKSIFFVLIFVCLKNIRWEKDTISRPFLLLGTALAFYCSIVFIFD